VATLERPTYHHGNLRSALVLAAVELVEESGVDSFSLREASRRVGVSASASYRHFRDRYALLHAVAEDGFLRLAEQMEREADEARALLEGPEAAVAAFSAVGRAYVRFAIHHQAQFRVMFGPWARGDQRAPCAGPQEQEDACGKSAHLALVRILDDLVTSGALEADAREQIELVAWAPLHGLARLMIDGQIPADDATLDASLAILERPLLIGLGVDPALIRR
jgi:AcrR family transcriptional regulator